jgi:phosphatidate cytidylyltransferase
LKAGLQSILRAFTGLFYISLSFALLLHLRSGALWLTSSTDMLSGLTQSLAKINGYYTPLVLIGSIWINDTMAYIVGSFIGKTPLSPISPKKTWEGTIGGIILSILIAFIIGKWMSSFTSAWQFAAIAAIASVAGTFGDLLESKIKRLAGVKDSGSIMPGHGGFMDRFDSLLIATPFVWGYLWLVA